MKQLAQALVCALLFCLMSLMAQAEEYVVQKGDCLSRLWASKGSTQAYATWLDQVVRDNKLSSADEIYVGSTLILPDKELVGEAPTQLVLAEATVDEIVAVITSLPQEEQDEVRFGITPVTEETSPVVIQVLTPILVPVEVVKTITVEKPVEVVKEVQKTTSVPVTTTPSLVRPYPWHIFAGAASLATLILAIILTIWALWVFNSHKPKTEPVSPAENTEEIEEEEEEEEEEVRYLNGLPVYPLYRKKPKNMGTGKKERKPFPMRPAPKLTVAKFGEGPKKQVKNGRRQVGS